MRNVIPLLAVAALAVLFTSGCAGPEQKLGRGVNNVYEAVRFGEMRRSIEQQGVLDPQGDGYAYGIVRGFDRSLARTGIGIYEVVTFPIPPYHAVFTKSFTSEPAYPDSFTPRRFSDSVFDTDTYVGFDGGDIAPFVPGSRFSIFDN
jgi:putative exosortase-associated protein (TIGR04073 family)